jgi:cation:H+ antiporter
MIDLIIWIIVFILSLFFLIKASDYFISSSENIGYYLNFPPIVIGIIILSIGTSLPELITSIFAILKDSSEIVIGTIIGSNISNLFLILGITAIVAKKIIINKNILRTEFTFFIATAFLLILIIFNGVVTIYETIILLLLFITYIFYTIKELKLTEVIQNKKSNKIIRDLFIFFISIVFIYFSAKYLIEATINISSFLNIGKEIIAVSAIALGTSLPELTVSIKAIRLKKHDLAIGNIIGSNIFNVVGILGISSLFGTVVFSITTLIFPLSLMLVGTIVTYFIMVDKKITIQEGILYILLYALFLFFLFGLI